MQRVMFLAYGIGSYLLFFVTYGYFACFMGNFLVPHTVDHNPTTYWPFALTIDIALLLAFCAQHSIMARPAFKSWWTRFVPEAIERSTYMIASCLALIALIWQWRPLPLTIWDVQNPVGWWLLTALFVAGWLLVPLVSLAINHFDLFGLRQVWLHFMGQPYAPLSFRTPLPYNVVRHPLYIAWAIAFWATPTMTAGHLMLAVLLTVYMLAASRVEERDLIAYFGKAYEDYQRRVPAFLPLPKALPTTSVQLDQTRAEA